MLDDGHALKAVLTRLWCASALGITSVKSPSRVVRDCLELAACGSASTKPPSPLATLRSTKLSYDEREVFGFLAD